MERISRLQEFLKQNPKDSFLQHALALEFIKEGKGTEACRLFKEILLRDPGYVGSYYHLAKLQEAMGETTDAVKTYEKGMEEAKKAGDMHSHGELKAAYEELVF